VGRWTYLDVGEISACFASRQGECIVYALYDIGKLIYVGRTVSIRERVWQHSRRFRFTGVKIRFAREESEQCDLERRLIARLKPEENVIFTGRNPQRGIKKPRCRSAYDDWY
jgi:hypothetical protein